MIREHLFHIIKIIWIALLLSCGQEDPSFVSSEARNAVFAPEGGEEDASGSNWDSADSVEAGGGESNGGIGSGTIDELGITGTGGEDGGGGSGDDDDDDDTGGGSGGEPLTIDDIVESCANNSQLVATSNISFPARMDCNWGTTSGGNEILSSNGNLSIKDGWLRAREENTYSVPVPANGIVCGVNLTSETDQIHFDDFFAVRMDQYIVAASKVLSNALEQDADGHYIWDWQRIRGDGTQATGTAMADLGKYCGTGACDLPEHDQSGGFAIDVALDGDDDASNEQNAALFAKLSELSAIDVTATATGDNDDDDCYHSGGDFSFEIYYVEK